MNSVDDDTWLLEPSWSPVLCRGCTQTNHKLIRNLWTLCNKRCFILLHMTFSRYQKTLFNYQWEKIRQKYDQCTEGSKRYCPTLLFINSWYSKGSDNVLTFFQWGFMVQYRYPKRANVIIAFFWLTHSR